MERTFEVIWLEDSALRVTGFNNILILVIKYVLDTQDPQSFFFF